MKYLGIDIGAASCRIALLDADCKIIERKEQRHHGKAGMILFGMVDALCLKFPGLSNEAIRMAVCGSMKNVSGLPKEYHAGETLALAVAMKILHPESGSCISIGAQKAYYLEMRAGQDPMIRKNSNCSAGTGSFFEEQAGRLEIPLEKISDTAMQAKTVPHIAGRCSVFSKTDIIHHMQEGTPAADLLMGLCFAMVRNYKANILQNRKPRLPVVLSGGVMKNTGVLRAFSELMEFAEADAILDENSQFLQVIGCALSAKLVGSIEELKKAICSVEIGTSASGLLPLRAFLKEDDSPEYTLYSMKPGKAALGIDIGSASINFMLLDEDKHPVWYSYIRNTGSPLTLVQEELQKLQRILPNGLTIEKTAVTGSGRERIALEIGAELTINEITAQSEGAALLRPETDTVFEIGGQDSKYMALEYGRMTDFEMNKVCAAGTGTFLEEQVRKLGISMEEFQDLALKSKNPCALGDRCTVFIEGSITSALSKGAKMEDVCAGLAYAIVSNYLNRVVSLNPIGDHVGIQGGVAYNKAVVCAFRALTGKEVHVSPYFSVTGALGAASLASNAVYLEFNKEINREYNRKLKEETEASYLDGYDPNGKRDPDKKTVGIPRVIFLHKMFPMFRAMFENLGINVLLSPLSTKDIVQLSQDYCTEETCYPIKLIYGHIAWLLSQNVDYIVLPRL